MPAASNIGSYLQDARNNFDAVRPSPNCADANQSIGQCQNVHISTNCYYGFHDLKKLENNHVDNDCEMIELEFPDEKSSKTTSRKRSADEDEFPQRKRLREDDSSMCSLVGTRSSPSHSASAFNANIPTNYSLSITYRLVFSVQVLYV